MDNTPNLPEDLAPAERLHRLLQANACIVYHKDLPDREYPQIKCSIFGAPKTNELFVLLTNGTTEFVESVESPVLFPAMADRIFGLDVLDHQAAFDLADKLWAKHRDELIGSGARRQPRQ